MKIFSITCSICGKVFNTERKGGNCLPKTCSKVCRYKSCALRDTKIPRICVVCGKEFFLPPSIAFDKRIKNSGIYCSVKCRWSKKLGYTEKEKWDARNAVDSAIKYKGFKRQNCSVCGESEAQAHHYKGYDKENWLKVIWLCKKHHVQEHERLRRLGLLNLL